MSLIKKKHKAYEPDVMPEMSVADKRRNTTQTYMMALVIMDIIVFYLSLHIFRQGDGSISKGLEEAFSEPLACFPPTGYSVAMSFMMILLVSAVILYLMIREYASITSNPERVKGSTELAPARELNEVFASPIGLPYSDGYDNFILGKVLKISPLTRYTGSLNTIVAGAPGAWKSRGFVKPNLLQMNCSYVVTDPSGEMAEALGELFYRMGYNVRVLDLNSMKGCDTYNPLKYAETENDIGSLVEAFVTNTKKEGDGTSKDPFWDESMGTFLRACASLLITYGNDPEIMDGMRYDACFPNLAELQRLAQAPIKDGDVAAKDTTFVRRNMRGGGYQSMIGEPATKLGHFFHNLEKRVVPGEETPYCLQEWNSIDRKTDKTYATILTTVGTRLSMFNIPKVKDLTATDTIDLNSFGEGRDVLFIIIPSQDKTYNFLASFLYTQLFQILYNRGQYDMEGSHNLVLHHKKTYPGGINRKPATVDEETELVKWFPASTPEKEINRYIESAKKASYIKIDVEDHPGDYYYVVVDGDFDQTEFLARTNMSSRKGRKYLDEHTITRRPEKDMAQKYIEALKHAELKRMYGIEHGHAQPIHCRFILDEFKNIGEIPGFKEKLATIRKYRISCDIILQSITQLQSMYGEGKWEEIANSCQQKLFLRNSEPKNNEWFCKLIGSRTAATRNSSIDKQGGISTSMNTDKEELFAPESLGRIPMDKELILIDGQNPILDSKHDFVSHPMYRYTKEYYEEKGVDRMVFDHSRFSPIKNARIIRPVTAEKESLRIIRIDTPEGIRDLFERCLDVEDSIGFTTGSTPEEREALLRGAEFAE